MIVDGRHEANLFASSNLVGEGYGAVVFRDSLWSSIARSAIDKHEYIQSHHSGALSQGWQMLKAQRPRKIYK